MIEITLTEIVLICWGVLATGAWASARDDARVAKRMLVLFIENKDARQQIIDAHEKFLKENGHA